MTPARKMLMETLVGHFALLEAARPRKASAPVARKARRHAQITLRYHEVQSTRRRAA